MVFPKNLPEKYLFWKCDENAHESRKSLVDKYEVSYEKQ